MTMRIPQLPQRFLDPAEELTEKERAGQSPGQQQDKPLLLGALDDTCVSRETYDGLDALTSSTKHSNNTGFGDAPKAFLGEVNGDGGIDGSEGGCDDSPTLENDQNPKKVNPMTTPLSIEDGCLGAVETGKYSKHRSACRDPREAGIDIVKQAGALLETLESASCRKTMVTLEVGMGSAVQVMTEGKFLELHETEVRTKKCSIEHCTWFYVHGLTHLWKVRSSLMYLKVWY